MNLRWLIGNFADPQYSLPWREQMRLSWIAHEKHLSFTRWVVWTLLLIVAPFLLLMKYIYGPFMSMAGMGNRTPWYWAGWLVMIVFVFWPWSALMYRALYIRPMRRAMREAGWDLCVNCGYELKGLNESISKCPECGAKREQPLRVPSASSDD